MALLSGKKVKLFSLSSNKELAQEIITTFYFLVFTLFEINKTPPLKIVLCPKSS